MQKLLLSIFFISLCVFRHWRKVRAITTPSSSTAATRTPACSVIPKPSLLLVKPSSHARARRRQFWAKTIRLPSATAFSDFDSSITYNFNRYFGIKGNVTGHYNTDKFVDTFGDDIETLNTKNRAYNFLVGVEVKDKPENQTLQAVGSCAVRRGDNQLQGSEYCS
jgi:hypothetical protein